MSDNSLFVNVLTENVISKLAQEEVGKRQYYRPIYSLHKWWARRPGVLFRSIILATASKLDFLAQEELLFVHDSRGELSPRSSFFKSHSLEQMIILDPFMGGGTTLAEANRLGVKVIGSDINPVSYWIIRETLKPLDIDTLDSYYSEIMQTVGEKIKSLYKTRCDLCGNDDQDILYAFWVRYVNCSVCGDPVYLFNKYLLNKGKFRNKRISRTNPATAVCLHCHRLTSFTGGELCTCSHCGGQFNPEDKTFGNGKYFCINCANESSLIKTVSQGNPIKEKLVAIEYFCKSCNERLYKTPDKRDLDLIKDIERDYESLQDSLMLPRQEIPKGTSSARWRAHQYNFYSQVFNSRQLMAFNYLINAINKIPEQEYKNAFITIFSNSLEYNNMMVPYNYPHRKLHHLFNYHALPLTTMPVENNVWGVDLMGAGTFANCFNRYRKAKLYAKTPCEKFKNKKGDICTIHPEGESIEAKLVMGFEELKNTRKGALLNCGDSSNLHFIEDKSVDAVISDPPYFDNIHYSELSNFFYVWLKLFKPDKCFIEDHVPVENEAIVNGGMDKTDEHYLDLMTSVFTECARVLKDNGLLAFTFHHSNPKAWWIILEAIRKSGFFVRDYFPVKSEYKVNPHVRGKVAIDTDLVIICMKQPDESVKQLFNLRVLIESATTRVSLNTDAEDVVFYFYFIGELLKVGSNQSSDIPFEDFNALFQQSPEFVLKYRIKYTKQKNDKSSENGSQLELFNYQEQEEITKSEHISHATGG